MGLERLLVLSALLQEKAAPPPSTATGTNLSELGHGIVSSLIFVGIGVVVFLLAFLLITKITPFSIRKEIEEDQNTALAIVIAAVMIGLSIIIAAAIHG
jgi:putative membrane protein